MENIEITTLPMAEHDAEGLRLFAYDTEGTARQVRLSDLQPRQMRLAAVDYARGVVTTRRPFFGGTSELYVNGIRYTAGRDYKELAQGEQCNGIEIGGIDSDDDIVLKAVEAGL